MRYIAGFSSNCAGGSTPSRFFWRAMRSTLWGYLFFIDIEGHQDDAPVKQALDEVRNKAPFLKIFGSYPAART